MLGILGDIVKTTVDVATTPLSVAADVITLGGTLNDRDEAYTETSLNNILKDIEDILNQ